MVLTPSTMLPLGTPLPAFELAQVWGANGAVGPGDHGAAWSSTSLSAQPVLVLFLCAHCPFVKHIEPGLSRLEADFSSQVQIVAISSNSTITHPQDGPEGLREQAARNGWRFPYLFDASQAVARTFHAACTPDLYLFDAAHQLVYRGQLDGSRPGNDQPLDGRDLRAAMAALLSGEPISADQQPSIGCNIKWHPEGV
ncbi:MAG: thioredoxin family protein [Vulcanococcus sp.]|uniref:thioredoxin family protein n=1 Tax=Vulcanococcus sp. TaxID=2856995 RepID=UPI0025FB9FCD|nr:thioredoxin family protein [Vulcanococcus sp.]MBW0166576.1 thioredoxin family protein [Vulcanococcus sp.]